MDNLEERRDFEVGDRVIVEYSNSQFYSVGNIGTVVDVREFNELQVQFDLGQKGLYELDGDATWYVRAYKVKLLYNSAYAFKDKSWLWKFFNTGL